jgi:hypothetical protein
MSLRRIMLWMLTLVLSCLPAVAASSPVLAPVPPPPMGWSSWNSFSNAVDSQIVMAQARAMIATGMHRAGYQYVNIDEGWWLGQRDAQGNIVVDPKAWPALSPGEQAGDMSNIVRFIHSRGLKAGIYTDAGESGCSMYPDLGPKYFHTGSEGHYDQDFLQFAKWGFDYVKVDWCGGDKENLDPAVQYAAIGEAIDRAARLTGHRLYFSLCEWGKNSPWTWAPHIGGAPADIWRTSGDIVAPIVAGHEHADRKASFSNMLANFDQGVHPEAEHTGFYNDPDMMVLGMPGLTDEQNRVHMALWAISGAPLLVGADLTTLSPATIAILTNPAVLAIDQDAAGLQAVKVAETAKGLQVWCKALARPGKRAVLLLNRTDADQQISVRWDDLGLDDSSAHVADAWTGRELASAAGSWSTTVRKGDAVLLLVSGTEAAMKTYEPAPNGGDAGATGQPAIRFEHVAGRQRMARIQIRYTNSAAAPAYASLQVNGQISTSIAFPPTGVHGLGFVWVNANLDRNGSDNVLTFSTDCGSPRPGIQSLAVQ